MCVCIYLKESTTTTTSVSLKNFKNWRTHTTEIHSILHSFINTSAGKVKVLQKQKKTRPKIKMPPTKNTTQIALYVIRPFLTLRVRVYVCALLVFPMSSLFSAFLHTPTHTHRHTLARIHSNIFCQTFSGFSLFDVAVQNAALSLHTHAHNYTHTTHTHTIIENGRLARTLSLSLLNGRSLSLLIWTAAGAQTKRRLLPRLARKSILQPLLVKYQKCINLPAK